MENDLIFPLKLWWIFNHSYGKQSLPGWARGLETWDRTYATRGARDSVVSLKVGEDISFLTWVMK